MPDQMLDAEPRTVPPAADPGGWRYGTAAVFGVAFAALLALLLVRDPAVFTLHVAERGDAAANSIIIEQAKHFHLLVGNYSRVGFSHPGPAFFYVQAFGEWLGYDVLHALPSPYNGQWLAVMVLNAALVAAALTVLWTWSRRVRPVLWSGAALLVFLATHEHLLSSTWMPFVYVAPFLLFITAAASVAAGRTAHLWLFALAGALLVHGHASFLLLFVPAFTVTTLVARWYLRRRRADREPSARRHWLWAAAVAAVFAVPMVLNLVLHWPGEYGKYLTYGGGHASAHGIVADGRYLLWFWGSNPLVAGALMLVLFGGTVLLARRQPDPALRRFLLASTASAALATVLFAGYILRGIDFLNPYIGYFIWAAPLLLLMLAATALDAVVAGAAPGSPRRRAATALPAAALAGALLAAAVSPGLSSAPERLGVLPTVVRAVSGYAAGRPAVLTLDRPVWPEMTGLLVAGQRAGQRLCVADPTWQFMVTSQYICDPAERDRGVPVHLAQDGSIVVVTFGGQVMTMSTRSD